MAGLVIKLSPGLITGALLGYRYPGFFLWFIDLDGGVEVSEVETTITESAGESKTSVDSNKK